MYLLTQELPLRNYYYTISKGKFKEVQRTDKDLDRVAYRIIGDHEPGWHSPPKEFRRRVHHIRRAKDRTEIYKILKNLDYEPNMSTWNCKDALCWD